ncbi:MAG: hypothetical protein ACPLRX_09135, partial [Candidatus Saccharicenans sp.]
KPITLFDLKVFRAFDLISEAQQGIYEDRDKFLESYVDQVLIQELAREQLRVSEDEIKQEINKSKQKIGEEKFNRKLLSLGLREIDLMPYFEGKILFDRVIGSRFAQKSYVSLKEIEDYYRNEYVPEQKARGQTPAELFQVLDELEDRLQRNKRSQEIKKWMEELRQRAEIMINSDCLKKINSEEAK